MRLFLLILFALLCNDLYSQTAFDYFYMEAEKCRLDGKYSAAMELYKHCLDINPDSPSAIHNLGILYTYLRQDSIGTAMIKRSCELDQQNPWYLETLASMYLNKRNIDEAIPVLERMAKLQTKRIDILSQLASMYKSTGQTDKAINILNKIEIQEGKSLQLSLEKHMLYIAKEEKDSAFMELQSLCNEYPHDMNYQVVMANQYQVAGDMDKANEIYDKVRSKDPTNINLHLARLAYFEDSGQEDNYTTLRDSLLYDRSTGSDLRVALLKTYIEDAQRDSTKTPFVEQAFDSLLSQPQEDVQILTLKAAYQMFSNAKEEKVTETLHKMLEVEPGNEFALPRLLQYYAIRRDYMALEDICRRGVNYHPEELLYAYYLGITLVQQDKNKEAVDILQQGLLTRTDEASSETVSDMYASLGDLYFQMERPEKAFAAYDSALVYVEDNISCLNNYAYYLSLRNEQLEKAEEMSYRTIKAEPDNITYLDTYAWILFMKKDYTSARIYIDRVAKPEKTDEELMSEEMLQGNLLEHAGDIHIMCGEQDTALRFWRLAQQKKDGTCTPSLNKKIKQKKYIK